VETLQDIRSRLKLTQAELANYLRIPRSRLAEAETGRCILTSAVLIKLAELRTKILNIPAEINIPSNNSSSELREYCINQIKCNRIKIKRLKEKYEQMRIKFLSLSHHALPNIECNKDEKIQSLIACSTIRIESYKRAFGPCPQKKILLHIYLLEEEIKAYKRYLTTLPK
jgi:transcriptional regulator with XRE-family HTH domain